MTHVTFLHGAHDRLQAVAAWLNQPAQKSAQIVVFAPDSSIANRLDSLLWTTPATGFLPHCRAESRLASETPVVLTDSLDNVSHDHCLLNLSDEVPPNFSRFTELVEIVSVEDTVRLPGRERFRFYRDRGYPVDNRDISNGV